LSGWASYKFASVDRTGSIATPVDAARRYLSTQVVTSRQPSSDKIARDIGMTAEELLGRS
jgi:hypothetical protein